MSKAKGFAQVYIILLAILAVVVLGVYYLRLRPDAPLTPVCPKDLRQCSDGSYVGRTAGLFNCEFKPCPTSSSSKSQDETANWKTYINTKYGFSFKYSSDYNVNNGVAEIKGATDDSALVVLRNKEKSNNFFVAVVIKKEYADPHAYNGSEYNPFTINIDKILNSKIGEKINIGNGFFSYSRLPDEKAGDRTASAFENGEKEGYLTVNTQKYIYVLGRYPGDLRVFQEIFSTFKFLDQNQAGEIMIIKGKILDANSQPFENPDLTINSINTTDKCLANLTGEFVCSANLAKGKTYSFSLNDRQNNRGFVLQYFSGKPGQSLDLGTRRAPWSK